MDTRLPPESPRVNLPWEAMAFSARDVTRWASAGPSSAEEGNTTTRLPAMRELCWWNDSWATHRGGTLTGFEQYIRKEISRPLETSAVHVGEHLLGQHYTILFNINCKFTTLVQLDWDCAWEGMTGDKGCKPQLRGVHDIILVCIGNTAEDRCLFRDV